MASQRPKSRDSKIIIADENEQWPVLTVKCVGTGHHRFNDNKAMNRTGCLRVHNLVSDMNMIGTEHRKRITRQENRCKQRKCKAVPTQKFSRKYGVIILLYSPSPQLFGAFYRNF